MSSTCTVTRSLEIIDCPVCSTDSSRVKAYLIVKVRPTGKYYIVIQHRDPQRGTVTHYAKSIEDLENLFRKSKLNFDEGYIKRILTRVQSEITKIFEELKSRQFKRIDPELEEVYRKVVTFLAHNVETTEDLSEHLRILEALLEVEKFNEECIALFNKGYNNLSDEEKARWRECIDLDCSHLGWSYRALSVKAGFAIPGPVITKLESFGIIVQTYRSRRSKYWRLALNRTKFESVIKEIKRILEEEKLPGLIKLLNKYTSRDLLEKFTTNIIIGTLRDFIAIAAVLIVELSNIDPDTRLKIIEYLEKFADKQTLNLDNIDEPLRGIISRILRSIRFIVNYLDKDKIIRVGEHIAKIEDEGYAKFLKIIFEELSRFLRIVQKKNYQM